MLVIRTLQDARIYFKHKCEALIPLKNYAKLSEHNFKICVENSLKQARIEYLEEQLEKIKDVKQ